MTVSIRRLGATLTVAAILTSAALNPALAAEAQRLEQTMEIAYRGTGRIQQPPQTGPAWS